MLGGVWARCQEPAPSVRGGRLLKSRRFRSGGGPLNPSLRPVPTPVDSRSQVPPPPFSTCVENSMENRYFKQVSPLRSDDHRTRRHVKLFIFNDLKEKSEHLWTVAPASAIDAGAPCRRSWRPAAASAQGREQPLPARSVHASRGSSDIPRGCGMVSPPSHAAPPRRRPMSCPLRGARWTQPQRSTGPSTVIRRPGRTAHRREWRPCRATSGTRF